MLLFRCYLILGLLQFRRRPTAKGVGLHVEDSHVDNHLEDGFTPLETIRRFNMEPRSMVVRVMKKVEICGHWGIDILGPLPTAPGNLKFLAIVVEHLTKFGFLKAITSKDDTLFKEGIFAELCSGLKITQSFSPITEHVEIMNHIKKQLARSQQGWVDDLARVLWFKLGDLALLFQDNKEGHNMWKGPHIISGVYEGELHKITDASDYSLV
ncbi:reverse transcriptase domain-containing protein [Tanacetum coccineum]